MDILPRENNIPIDDNTLTNQQIKTVQIVYSSALLPVIGLLALYVLNLISNWIIVVYFVSFALCALGWEIWFTYGIIGGQSVNVRRSKALNQAIPQNVNWLLNSLADAGSICLVGLLFVWILYGFDTEPFSSWHCGAFFIFFMWFVGQNIYVELVVYHEQLDEDKLMSWAPLTPLGPWWNPTLFEIKNRPVKFQTQIPWVLVTPIFYWIVIISNQ